MAKTLPKIPANTSARTSARPHLAVVAAVPASAYRLDDQIGFELRRAYQRASGNLAAAIQSFELTPPQFSTLARLFERGAVSQNLLGRLVGMESANIRDVVQRLKKRGLVRAERHREDKRAILLSLTKSGRELIETLQPLSEAATEQTLQPLRAGERRHLFDLLRRIQGEP